MQKAHITKVFKYRAAHGLFKRAAAGAFGQVGSGCDLGQAQRLGVVRADIGRHLVHSLLPGRIRHGGQQRQKILIQKLPDMQDIEI